MSTGAAHHTFINQRTSFPPNHYSSSRPSTPRPSPPPLKVCAAVMTCEHPIVHPFISSLIHSSTRLPRQTTRLQR